AARRGQGHVDGHLESVGDVDLVDQAELVDVDRNLRVEHGLELADQLVGELGQSGAVGCCGYVVHHAKKPWALMRASTNESASSRVLYRAKEALALDVRPKRRISGSAQWVPARTATP